MADSQSTTTSAKPRTSSISQVSESSQTAAEFIKEQLSLEAEAREALPYQFDTCTRDLGPLRQSLYACLTCSPPPASAAQVHTPAGVCYSCSISCHGEHTLVELFNKRDFICDCGTTRMPENVPCTLRINAKTGQKGGVTGEEAAKSNKYNQNFKNRFCGCGEDYDAHQEKGTMFQCLGLGTVVEGGCGEDWWHPECLVGFTREEYAKSIEKPEKKDTNGTDVNTDVNVEDKRHEIGIATPILDAAALERSGEDGNDMATAVEQNEDEDTPLPPGFPPEDDFDHFLCYKCVEANPWIKKLAGSPGFLPPVYTQKALNAVQPTETATSALDATNDDSKKRKASDADDDELNNTTLSIPVSAKRQKSENPSTALSSTPEATTVLPTTPKKEDISTCKLVSLPPLPTPALTNSFSLFLKPDFRDHLCRCASCFPLLKPHPQLLEEEDTYEPPISEDGDEGVQSVGTGSILDRGEAAFNNMDRVRAIQGAMAYAQLKDKVSAFLKPFAESGKAVGAEDVKAYFEKLRGDEQGIQEAAVGAKTSKSDEDGDAGADGNTRKEQSGY
ncbi:RING-type E3 ubiquitin transferase [Ascochyta rabiei]|uniref:Ubiquitin-protein transferase n=1 Tax=Didymella rabiei TaxID=5454 RepID=A0A162VCN5_DIDRA|nr:RING-type E3 ubiquitin transferase [Ascochyta rabiei]KZM18365.1 ubiquitin-protein transferase [Ascochyta rabiei]UPX09601.1 RING-type E3 ubiquitin transferase [Ascochyta rabiei]